MERIEGRRSALYEIATGIAGVSLGGSSRDLPRAMEEEWGAGRRKKENRRRKERRWKINRINERRAIVGG